jgi:acyl-CoA thioester hydrolase
LLVQQLDSAFIWPITIYYEDTDAGGVVYHANYLNFFERARTEMLRSRGIAQHTLLESGIGFVVRKLEIDYFDGAKLDDSLTVMTVILQIKKATILFCQELVNPDQKVLCRATVKVACINTKLMKPTAIPLPVISELSK